MASWQLPELRRISAIALQKRDLTLIRQKKRERPARLADRSRPSRHLYSPPPSTGKARRRFFAGFERPKRPGTRTVFICTLLRQSARHGPQSATHCQNPQVVSTHERKFKKVHVWLDKIGEHFEKSASSVGRMHLSEPWKPDATLSMHRMILQSSEARSLQQTPIPAEKCSMLILQI